MKNSKQVSNNVPWMPLKGSLIGLLVELYENDMEIPYLQQPCSILHKSYCHFDLF